MQRDYSTGLELVTLRTWQAFAKECIFSPDTTLAPPPLPQRIVQFPSSGGGGIPPFAIFIIFIVILVLLSNARRRGGGGCGPGCLPLPIIIPPGTFGGGRRSGWGGGGWGGGGGGGGGGVGGGGVW